jgi:crotonobetainyl-CoA:carnitine CoA-transferase CaiB-like acyl-CoA transferase
MYRPYPTADGAVALACYAPTLQPRALRALGLEALLEDPAYATLEARAANSGALAGEIERVMRERPSAHWVARLREAGLPHGEVSERPLSLLDHPGARALGLITTVEHPVLGTEEVVGPPLRLSRTPAVTRRPAPLLGEHTDEVLAELGTAAR